MGEGPSCALHAERESAGVCASCGAPACATCLLPASDRCRACDERLRHGAEDLGVRAVFALAWSLFRGAFFPVAGVALAFAIPAAAADLVCDALKLSFPEDAQLQGSVALVVGVVGTLAMTRLLVLASRGAPLRAGEALLFALRRWPAAVALTFITELIISLGLLLLVVPGVVAALNLSLALPLLAATRLDANQAMRRSKALVAGERRRLFWPLLLSFVATALPGQLLAMLPAILSASAPSLAAPVPAALIAFATEAIAGLLGGFFLAVLVACFAKIARRGDVALQGLGNQLA